MPGDLRDEKVWGDAYNISNGGKTDPKVEHVANLLDRLWARRKHLRPQEGDSLLGFHARLKDHEGVGNFMAAQIVADVKYVEPLRSARDWMTFAASGPGKRRTRHQCGHMDASLQPRHGSPAESASMRFPLMKWPQDDKGPRH